NNAGSFTNANAGLPGAGFGSAVWGDYDNDGDLDILLAGSSTTEGRISRIYRNDDGAFMDIDAGLIGVSYCRAAWGDYDNDGDLDILLAGDSAMGRISRIYRNDDGVFTDIDAGLQGISSGGAAWGDYDNDGDLDVLLSGNYKTYLYRNDAGVFTDVGGGLTGGSSCSVAWGDYDNDGDLDYLLAGGVSSDPISRIFRNDGAVTNTPPLAPSGLAVTNGAASPSGVDMEFRWSGAGDVETPSAGLTYNIRLGTNALGETVKSAMANLTNGWRRVAAMGNANQATTQRVTSLSRGRTYYWSVQAVDGAFAGGVWSGEGSFTAPELPSVATYAPSNIFATTMDYSGAVTNQGGSPVTGRGVVWGTNALVSTTNYLGWADHGSGTGAFGGALTNLTPVQTYYLRAYASNGLGLAYGDLRSFATSNGLTVTTYTPSNITPETVACSGDVATEDVGPVLSKGFVWHTNSSVWVTNRLGMTDSGGGTGAFSDTLTNLMPAKTYYVRAYASNSYGSSYGGQNSFTTLSGLPTMSTLSASNLTTESAWSGGRLTSMGASSPCTAGVLWSTNASPSLTVFDGLTAQTVTTTGVYEAQMTGLISGQRYYFRAYATNAYGAGYGGVSQLVARLPGPGHALTVDGAGDYASVADRPALDLTNNYTIEIWFKPKALTSVGGLVSKYHSAGANGYLVRLSSAAPYDGITFDEMTTTNGLVTTGCWHHVAAVNSNGARTLYLNGIRRALSGTPLAVKANADALVVGMDYLPSARYFNGQIDEVRLWSCVLSEDEVRDAMHRVLTGTESHLVAYYTCDPLAGTFFWDATGHGNDGALFGNAGWTNSTLPCAVAITNRNNIRGAWLAQSNSLASSVFSVSGAAMEGTDFRVFGHDGGALTNDSSDKPVGYLWRLNRAWQTEGTGTVTGTLTFDYAGISNLVQNSALLRLMTDADGTFSDAGSVAGNFSDGVFMVAEQPFPANGYFTLGERISSDWIIAASCGANGTMAPSGSVAVAEGGETNFAIAPALYWHVADVTTNGASVGSVTAFMWSNIVADGVIHAEFAADLAALGTPCWWLAQYGWTNDFDYWETNDTDSDWMQAWEEQIAGTNPTNRSSRFQVSSPMFQGSNLVLM
ncbi:MAG: LamG-like jellyroll fold domain-containing protein, partial [Lentisphaerota bacterium]